MAVSSIPNEMLIRGIGDILDSQPQSVWDNLERLEIVRETLYDFIDPVMSQIVGILGSGSEEYLKYIVCQDAKTDKKDLFYGFKKTQRDRID